MNLLHAVAYRRGLGNSLFCGKHRAGKISPETLQHYVGEQFVTSRAAVVGYGIDYNELLQYAQNCGMQTGGDVAEEATKYYGGEAR